MIPTIGRIVHYKLHADNAANIRDRRAIGPQFVGNPVKAGDVYPMMITRVWDESPTETSCVQGQVFLDGNDTVWVTSVTQGENEGQWKEPKRTA